MRDLVLYGAGGLGRETATLVGTINLAYSKYNLLGFVVDEEYYQEGQYVNWYPVLGSGQWLIDHKDSVVCCVAISDPYRRGEIQEYYESQGVEFVSLIAPDVYIDTSVRVGPGSIIQSRCLLSVNTVLGKGTFLNSDVIVGHDTKMGDYVSVLPRAQVSGHVTVGNYSRIGAMSFLCEGIKVGNRATVTPGSVVFYRVKDDTTVIGNPAKKIDI